MADVSAVHIDSPILEGLRRKDHVVFFLNTEGVHPDEGVGYSLVNEIIVGEGMTNFKSIGNQDFGHVMSQEDEGSGVWFHGIVCHSIRTGWPLGEDEEEFLTDPESAYAAIVTGLNKIWEDHEDDVVRPIRTVWPATAKMRNIGDTKGDVKKGMAALCASNSMIPLEVYVA